MNHARRVAIARRERQAWRNLYARVCARSDAVTICSEADRERLDFADVHVVPNSYPELAKGTRSNGERWPNPTLVIAGFYAYEPNERAACVLAGQILPRIRQSVPNAQLRIVGPPTKEMEALRRLPGVTLTGYVPDLVPELCRADVIAVPVDVVAGTNVKIIEGLAFARPVVTSPAAAQNLQLTDGQELLARDDVDSFAQGCVQLLRDRVGADALAARGHDAYVRRFRTDVVVGQVASIAQAVLARGAAS